MGLLDGLAKMGVKSIDTKAMYETKKDEKQKKKRK